MKKYLILLIFVALTFNSCRMDVEPSVSVNNDIKLSIDGENMDGIIGEWTITTEEKKEDDKHITVITINKIDVN
jgi:hypothetical protein